MFKPFRGSQGEDQAQRATASDHPSLYPEGTPGKLFLSLSPKELLLLIRGVREAAQHFRTNLQGLAIGQGHMDAENFHSIFPALIEALRDQFDFETIPVVDLIENTAALYSDPKNANVPLLEALSQSVESLSKAKRDMGSKAGGQDL